MKRKIPFALIFMRIAMGICMLFFSVLHLPHFPFWAISLFSIGLLTDILDGILARRWNVSSQRLRRLDSTADQLFFILVLVATYIHSSVFFHQEKIKLIILCSAECLTYVICFIKFKREIAIHAVASKLWTLFLFATIIQLLATSTSGLLFEISFYLGIATRLEIIAIILVLHDWTHDVPGICQAVLIRQGKPVRRHKLFNG